MSKELTHVAYITGGADWGPCAISMYSVLRHHPNRRFHFHILTDEPPRDEFELMMRWLESRQFAFEYDVVAVDSFESVYDHKHSISPIIVNKVRLDRILPDSVGEVVYLDSDTLFLNAADELLTYELEGSAVVGVPDNSVSIQFDVENLARFVNGGVLKFNLKEWRRRDMTARNLEYLAQHEDYKLEETSLNVIAHQMHLIDYLPPEFNSITNYSKRFEAAGKLPKIVHYASIEKPWYRYTNTPLGESWMKVCLETPLADMYPTWEGFRSYLPKKSSAKSTIIFRATT
jgi:lipopolysaccharide biosynthesis glycosyltransferase